MYYVKVFDSRLRLIRSVHSVEAAAVVGNNFGTWIGKKRDRIKIYCTKQALLAYIHMMRVQPLPDCGAADSTTCVLIGGNSRYQHVHTDAYSTISRIDFQ